ncbi:MULTISPECIES: sulfurtransferase [Ramlibacter]|uniref:Sulfurtransferase n=1 Tax=Ramlibacter pinisoli TaxID=2682844 RepID=A0A6N8IPH4_9BURK|nr:MULTISPECIES: sulfurtransferase [Ramlibacter]MBA2963488.1 sulfurtransferase [Ramlibacter sp. CGMCC 1.13660]MVQ28455.1 sulfurtransferase [Ramlibacter pinisoli]
MDAVLNVSGYRFARLDEPQHLRDLLHAEASALGLRGTILLAHEGINLFLAGHAPQVDALLALVRRQPGLQALEAKRSWSRAQPFRRLLVKVKREIIRMNQPAIAPQAGRAPAVDAAKARRWLDQGHDDEGRPVVTLDTRNAFEVDYGTFDGAIDWRLQKFSDFPAALQAHRAELEGKTVVSFCTGGIRCEKAVLAMQAAGLQHVWQLEGGILKYFEEAGGSHFHGRCFVFDEREALDAGLASVRE